MSDTVTPEQPTWEPWLLHGDCLDLMRQIPDGIVDLVLCDLPYGTTACKWDVVLPFEALWEHYWRVCKGAVVLTSSQPFTSALIMSAVKHFKYTWTWDKVNGVRNHLNAKHQPMRVKEDVCVFYKDKCTYNPIMRPGGYKSRKTKPGQSAGFGKVTGVDSGKVVTELYPVDIICIESQDPNNSKHPTMKPTALMEYFVQTYTNVGDVVLDNTMGSGTTGVACKQLNRKFIGIEKDDAYFALASKRIADYVPREKPCA